MKRRIILFLVAHSVLFGVGSMLYGVAKIAMAEEPKQMSVEIDLPNAVALTAPDMATRNLGYRACGLGGIFLFAAGALYMFSAGTSRETRGGGGRQT